MKTRVLFLVGVAVKSLGLLPPPVARAQRFFSCRESVTQTSASAHDTQVGDGLPPDLSLALRTNAFSQLLTNVDLAWNVTVSGACAKSLARILANIQPLAVALSGAIIVGTTTVANRANSASALAAHRFDLLFELPCTLEASLRTFLEGGVNCMKANV